MKLNIRSAAARAAAQIEKIKPAGVDSADFLALVQREIYMLPPNEIVKQSIERGLKIRNDLADAEGGSYSSEELVRILKITRQAIDQRREARKLVAWKDSRNNWRYPVWQLNEHGGVRDRIEEILAELPDDSWSVMLFFLSHDEALGARPLDRFREGKITDVIESAMRYGRQGA